MNPAEFCKEEKHELWCMLNDTVRIDNTNQVLMNAIKIYVRSVFDAINDEDISKIRFFSFI